LSTIVSSDNFTVSEKLLVVQDIDYIDFIQSFDVIGDNAEISDYEKHYVIALKKLSDEGKCQELVYEVAKYEYDKLEFLRYVDKNVYTDTIKVCVKTYGYNVHEITESTDISKTRDKKIQHYVFYYSPKTLRIKVILVNQGVAQLVGRFFENKKFEEINEVIQHDEVCQIPMVSQMLCDYGL